MTQAIRCALNLLPDLRGRVFGIRNHDGARHSEARAVSRQLYATSSDPSRHRPAMAAALCNHAGSLRRGIDVCEYEEPTLMKMGRLRRLLLGPGRLPEPVRTRLLADTDDVLVLEEGLFGSVTYRHYRART